MKIDFFIISVILVITSFLPFILLPLLGNKNRKNLSNNFKDAASKAGINISFKLQWNNNIAGIDILNKQFLFLQCPENDIISHQIDLNQMREVKLEIRTIEIQAQKKVLESLSRIDLEFYSPSSQKPIIVNLFDYDLNYMEDLEVKNSQKLLIELKKYITAKPLLRNTA